jgi:type IV secretory pathway VirB3-like protein
MADALPGWHAPVYSGMAAPPSFHGVPQMFFVFDLLGTLFVAFIFLLIQPVYSVLVVLVGASLYGIVYVCVQVEPRLGRILREYRGYQRRYEG